MKTKTATVARSAMMSETVNPKCIATTSNADNDHCSVTIIISRHPIRRPGYDPRRDTGPEGCNFCILRKDAILASSPNRLSQAAKRRFSQRLRLVLMSTRFLNWR
jgi:hypothetical protein